MNFLLWSLLVASGAAGLIYEILWARQLALIFGVSSFAIATVLAVFMGGLALGSTLFGRWVDRGQRPLRWYASIEAGIGIWGLLSPFGLAALDPIYVALYPAINSAEWVGVALKFLLAAVVLLPPAILMGGTLPILSRFVVRSLGEVGSRVGALYAWNTVGAVLGCFLAGFVLVAAVGVRSTLLLAVALNVLVAVGAMLLDRAGAEPTQPALEPATKSRRPAGEAGEVSDDLTIRLVTWGFAVTGFAALCYEVFWTRLLVYILGQSTYTFATVLTTFLLGIAVGSFIFARLADRSRDPVRLFALTQVAGAVAAFCVLPSIPWIMAFFTFARGAHDMESWWFAVAAKFAAAGATMFVPTVLLGGAFPIVSRIVARRLDSVGGTVGHIYAANTIGAIAGSVAAGFVLIPVFGVRVSLALVTCLSFGLGMLLFTRSRGWQVSGARVGAVAALAAFLVANVSLARTTPLIFSTARIVEAPNQFEVLYSKEGIDASLAVIERRLGGIKELNINGTATAFTGYEDIQVHLLLGHLPMLFHPDPREVLVVGFGFGSTSRAALCYDVDRVDCVELVRDEVETAPLFFEQNRGALHDPRFNLIIGDGRNHILATRETYDAISFNAVHPKHSPNLYTRDFYELCRARLKPNGTVCAWIPTNLMTEGEYRSVIATFAAVFPHSTLWWNNPGHTVLVATGEPLELDYSKLSRRLALPKVREHLAEVNLAAPMTLLGTLLLNETDLHAYIADVPIDTDDHPLIEFSRATNVLPGRDVLGGLEQVRSHPASILASPLDSGVVDGLDRQYDAMGHVLHGQIADWLDHDIPGALESFRAAAGLVPDDLNLAYLQGVAEHERQVVRASDTSQLADVPSLTMKARLDLAEGRSEAALDAYRRAVALAPEAREVHHNLARALGELGRPGEALPLYEKALALDPEYVSALVGLAATAHALGDLPRAREALEQALALDPDDAGARSDLGVLLRRLGDEKGALVQSLAAVRAEPTLAAAHANIGLIYARRGNLAAAEKAFLRVLNLSPDWAEAHNNLALLHLKTGDAQKAEAGFRRALASDPGYARAHANLGALYAQQGDINRAIGEWRRALELDPNEPVARANLARALKAEKVTAEQSPAKR